MLLFILVLLLFLVWVISCYKLQVTYCSWEINFGYYLVGQKIVLFLLIYWFLPNCNKREKLLYNIFFGEHYIFEIKHCFFLDYKNFSIFVSVCTRHLEYMCIYIKSKFSIFFHLQILNFAQKHEYFSPSSRARPCEAGCRLIKLYMLCYYIFYAQPNILWIEKVYPNILWHTLCQTYLL